MMEKLESLWERTKFLWREKHILRKIIHLYLGCVAFFTVAFIGCLIFIGKEPFLESAGLSSPTVGFLLIPLIPFYLVIKVVCFLWENRVDLFEVSIIAGGAIILLMLLGKIADFFDFDIPFLKFLFFFSFFDDK